MATQVIDTPGGLEVASFYYPQLKASLLAFLRQNKERLGLTDENEYEVHVQLLSAFSLMGHLNNTYLDAVATEMFLDSANLLESVKKLFKLMGISLKSATPAVAELIAKLTTVSSINVTSFIPALAEFTTEGIPPLVYEASVDGQALDRTDQVKLVYGLYPQSTGSTGQVSSDSPDVFKDTGVTWPTDVVGDVLLIEAVDAKQNSGMFRVSERISGTEIRVVVEPGGTAPAFTTETGLVWHRLRYTADQASEANDDTITELVTPWSGAPSLRSQLFVSHRHVMPTRVDMTFQTIGAGFFGVWEYYDGLRSLFNPKSVTGTSTLVFDCETLLGPSNRAGAQIRVVYLVTGASKVLTSTWSGSANLVTTTFLFGQVSPSNDIEDYYLTSLWVPFANSVDSTVVSAQDMRQNGNVRYDLPQTRDRSWNKVSLNGQEACFWLRYRVVSAGSISPVFHRIKIDGGEQWVLIPVTQGETIGPQILGSSTGQPNQSFKLPETPYLDDSEIVEVDEGGLGDFITYTRVETFLNSDATSRHYTRDTTAQDEAIVLFGDGIRGKIPPVGLDNVQATYRIGGDENGNVGIDQIVTNSDGIGGITDLTNPRPAFGWIIKDGGDTNDFNRIKRDAPATLRIRDTAARPQDAERLAVDSFRDDSGLRPVVRAFAVEEGFGIKTLKLLVVGAGGSSLTTAQLTALSKYFNGDRYARPPVTGVCMMNYKVYPVNFEPTLISINATVVWNGGSVDAIKNQLIAFLTPTSLEDDGATFVWDFGGQISFSRIHSLIHAVDPNVIDVPVLQLKKGTGAFQSSSLQLGQNELPITTGTAITITIQET